MLTNVLAQGCSICVAPLQLESVSCSYPSFVFISGYISRSQYSALYSARSCEPTMLMWSIKLPCLSLPPPSIFSAYAYTEPQSRPWSIRTFIVTEPIDIKLSSTYYSSAVPLVYLQLNSALPRYVSLNNSLLTAMYRPPNRFYYLHSPLIDWLLL